MSTDKIALLRNRGVQLTRYGLVGVLATAVHYALMAFLLSKDLTSIAASTAGAALGAIVAYLANRKWTFEARHTSAKMLRFLLVALLGLLLNGILLVTIQSWLISSIIGAQLLTTGLVFVATFFINLKWSFA